MYIVRGKVRQERQLRHLRQGLEIRDWRLEIGDWGLGGRVGRET